MTIYIHYLNRLCFLASLASACSLSSSLTMAKDHEKVRTPQHWSAYEDCVCDVDSRLYWVLMRRESIIAQHWLLRLSTTRYPTHSRLRCERFHAVITWKAVLYCHCSSCWEQKSLCQCVADCLVFHTTLTHDSLSLSLIAAGSWRFVIFKVKAGHSYLPCSFSMSCVPQISFSYYGIFATGMEVGVTRAMTTTVSSSQELQMVLADSIWWGSSFCHKLWLSLYTSCLLGSLSYLDLFLLQRHSHYDVKELVGSNALRLVTTDRAVTSSVSFTKALMECCWWSQWNYPFCYKPSILCSMEHLSLFYVGVMLENDKVHCSLHSRTLLDGQEDDPFSVKKHFSVA